MVFIIVVIIVVIVAIILEEVENRLYSVLVTNF